MEKYIYINDYEREETQKYEGTYTAQEIELNKKLMEACTKDTIDFVLVEELLKQGADPLGGTALFGWDLITHIYGELMVNPSDSTIAALPRLTELFLKYGMDVDNPRIPYDDDNSLHPLWHFAFVVNEHAIWALKLLLDHGLSVISFAEFWDHAISDYFNVECGDPQNDKNWNYECTWAFKMLLLGASYDHIWENDEGLREFVCCDHNAYDVHNFRNWDDFEYFFDTSSCERHPELYGCIVHIYEKKTHTEVWKIGVGVAGREILDCQ